MPRKLQAIRYWLLGTAIIAAVAAAAGSPWTPELGRNALRWSPVWLGLPVAAAFLFSEFIARGTQWAPARLAATIALGVVAGVALLRLWLGYSTPAASRELDTWHLWPLFTLLNLTVLGGPFYLLALVLFALGRKRAAA